MWKERFDELRKEFQHLRNAIYLAGFQIKNGSLTVADGYYFDPPRNSFTADADQKKKESLANRPIEVRSVAIDSSNLAQIIELLKQQPEVIELMRTRPRIVIESRPKVVRFKADHINSKIGCLVLEGFFDSPRSPEQIANECKRRGFIAATTRNAGFLSPRFKELVEFGVLTLEPNGYLKVPGIQIEQAEG